MEISISNILQVLSRSRRPRSGREIASALGVSSREKQEVYSLLRDLVRQGEVKRLHGGKFTLPKQKKPQRGKIHIRRNGSGIVSTDGGQREIKVPERALFGAMHGDLVEVVTARSRGSRPEGRVIRVLEREQKELVGLYQQDHDQGYVLPIASGTPVAIRIKGSLPAGLKTDQIVIIKLADGMSQAKGVSGTILEVLGDADDPEVEMRVVARRFGIPTAFPENVSTAAQRVAQQVSPGDIYGRKDLRDLPFVTIDGETAKDFDDAVTLSMEPSGHYRLFVAIADVAHYVPEGGPIDVEALHRGTSVYLPGACLPMLPEALSNGICSLNPQVDRLVMVAEIQFDRNAVVIDTAFSEAVICSHARLTYTEVQRFLDENDPMAGPPHLGQLVVMQELASRLIRQRLKRGALDLDIPEAEILLDNNGQPESIVRLKRTQAHRLIEEFMLAANEAVASSLSVEGFPLLYRVHEPPAEQDLEPFFLAAKRLGAAVGQGKETLLDRLQTTLASVNGDAEQGILNRLLLRSLKQAYYDPENKGHFGLASDHYCHFTSPIRRYPDLLVHRMLKQRLAGANGEALAQQEERKFLATAEQASSTERRAIDAERDASAMKTCQFMVQHTGEIHAGHVTSVHPFGFFVELDDIFVEGMVHVSTLGDTYYRYEDETSRLIGEGTNIIYAVGTQVTVVVRDVNVQRREIDFVVQQKQGAVRGTSAKKVRRRKR